MLYAVLTQSRNPQRLRGMPAECIYSVIKIKESERQTHIDAGFHVQTFEEHKEYIEKVHNPIYTDWLENHSPTAGDRRLKVYDVVSRDFEFWPPCKVDFRRHLMAGVNFEKKVVMMANGRPSHADYYLGDQLMARIRFVFEVDSFNFMVKRTEILSYVRKDGEMGHEYVIWSQTYDKTNPFQQSERIQERVEARTHIFSTIKAKVETFLAMYFMGSQGLTYDQVLTIAGEFSIGYSALISAWKDTGTPALKSAISSDETTQWLNLVIPAAITGLEQDMSIREYIIHSLSY